LSKLDSVVLLAGLGIAAAISLVGFGLTRTTVAAVDAAGATELDMVAFEFEPHDSVLLADGRLLIHNSDAFAHDFTLEENDLYTYIGPGGEAVVDLIGLSPGEYEYFCSLHTFETEDGEREGMTGILTIEGWPEPRWRAQRCKREPPQTCLKPDSVFEWGWCRGVESRSARSFFRPSPAIDPKCGSSVGVDKHAWRVPESGDPLLWGEPGQSSPIRKRRDTP
jgi:hypothetical protein